MTPSAQFIDGNSLKNSLGEIAKHFETLPEEIISLGTMAYAEFPPIDMENQVTAMFDTVLADLRGYAKKRLEEKVAERDSGRKPSKIPEALMRQMKAMDEISKRSDKHRNPVVPKSQRR